MSLLVNLLPKTRSSLVSLKHPQPGYLVGARVGAGVGFGVGVGHMDIAKYPPHVSVASPSHAISHVPAPCLS